MTTPDLPDWGQPVGTIERLTQFVAADTPLAAGGALGPFDTSQVNNLLMRIVVPSVGTVEYYSLEVEWLQLPTPLFFSFLSFHSTTAYPATAGQFYWQIPVRGPSCQLNFNGSTVDPCKITVIGSTRQLTDERLAPNTTTPPRLIDTGNVTVAAGALNTQFHIPPVARAVRVVANYASANITLELKGIVPAGVGSAAAVRAWRDNCTSSSSDVFDEIVLPNTGCDLTINNTDSVSHVGSVQIWDVS